MSPSASWLVTVAVRVWPVVGIGGRDRDRVDDRSRVGGGHGHLGRDEGAAAVPSEGVTSTDTTSPASPLPARQRSKVSVRLALAAVVLRVVPLTFQT